MLIVVDILALHRFVLMPELQNPSNAQPERDANEEKHPVSRQPDQQYRHNRNRRYQPGPPWKQTS